MNNKLNKIVIASDHSGIEVKETIINHLQGKFEIVDLGPFDSEVSVDYAQFGIDCGEKAIELNCLGIVICGTGVGISIACNKVQGVRCSLLYNNEVAKLCKEHNNANVIAFGARQFSIKQIIEMLDIFLEANFEGGRHNQRLETISNYEINKKTR
ncbi:MAG: RpiB/LacA/LacB family sugar-phosphate isomerase [Mycoplasma sp.]